MGDGVVLVATNKRILVLILAAIIVTMLTIFGILFENIQRYNIRTSWQAAPAHTKAHEQASTFVSLGYNFTDITYYDWMPSPYLIQKRDWDNPNFWARFQYWTIRKQVGFVWNVIYNSKPTKVVEGLYLGNVGAQLNKEMLHQLEITHILNAAVELEPMWPNEFIYKQAPNIKEEMNSLYFELTPLLDWLDEVYDLGGTVLISWFWGENRSASLVIGYLMHHYDWNYDEAFHYLNNTQRVTPYRYFRQSLRDYDIMRKNPQGIGVFDNMELFQIDNIN